MSHPAKYEYQGKYYTLRELLPLAKVKNIATLHNRLTKGWSVERALKEPKCPPSAGGRKVSKRPECRVFVEPRRG